MLLLKFYGKKTLGKLDPRAPGLYSHTAQFQRKLKFGFRSMDYPRASVSPTDLNTAVFWSEVYEIQGGLSPQKIPEHYLNNNHVSSKFNIIVILQNVSCSLHHRNLQPPALKLLCFKYNFWRSFAPQTRVSWRVLLCFCFQTI